MKRILLLIGALLLTSLANAQVEFGVKGGVNLANAKVGGSSSGIGLNLDSKIRPSFYLGGYAEFALANGKSIIQAELLYSQLGTVMESNAFYDDTTIKLTQLTIPLIGKHRIYENLNFYGGSYFGFNLKAEEEYNDGETYDATEDYTLLDVGLIAGLEYHFENGLFVDARYNFGLTNNVNTEVYAGTGSEVEYKNRTIQIGLGYKF